MNRYDVLVIGGGPAGSVAASTLAAAGRSVLLLEKEHLPRFHIGESLLPLSRPVLERIGVWPRLEAEGFPVKRGAAFTMANGASSLRADFSSLLGARGTIFNVPRARFDEVLLDHAASRGAQVRQGCRVDSVEFPAGGAEVAFEEAGRSGAASARFVLDASGRHGVIARRLGLRRVDGGLRKVAVYSHFTGVPRDPGERDGDVRVISRPDLGWIWFIPVSDTVTSVGAVFDRSVHVAGSRPEDVLARIVAETPIAAELMSRAVPVMSACFEGDFSYAAKRYAGDGWLLGGDAGSFIDPVFSTGVHLAIHAGWEAAQALLDGSRAALRRYERLQRRRYVFYRNFVAGFYRAGFRDLFFQPGASESMYRAIAMVLAGDDRPGLRSRLLIRLFVLLGRAQSVVPLVARLHGTRATRHQAALAQASHAG